MPCSVPGCTAIETIARGHCRLHYQLLRRTGTTRPSCRVRCSCRRSVPSTNASALPKVGACASCTTRGHVRAAPPRSCLARSAPSLSASATTTPRATACSTTADAGAHTAPRPAWARLRKEALRAPRSTRPGQRAVAVRPPHDRGGWDARWPVNETDRRPLRCRGVLALPHWRCWPSFPRSCLSRMRSPVWAKPPASPSGSRQFTSRPRR